MRRHSHLLLLVLLLFLIGCSNDMENLPVEIPEEAIVETPVENKEIEETIQEETQVELFDDVKVNREEQIAGIISNNNERKPSVFGENIPGVYTKIKTDEMILALTFDACGGKHGSQVDIDLLTYLIEEKIPATLFINGRWMDANQEFFLELSKIPFFDLQNHGMDHKPLSTSGESIYGITGTKDLEEALHEVLKQQENMEKLIHKAPGLFRSGTAYYDDVALEVLDELDIKAVNFSILGDAGATYTVDEMVSSAMKAKPGDILLYHMNHPEKSVAEGIKRIIPLLKGKGYGFVKLSDYEDQLE